MVISDVANWLYDAGRWTWHDPDGYNFISGPLADITLFGGAYAIARRHNCHVKGCWRVGRARVPGTEYIVCHRHHPHERPTAEKVLQDHEEAMRRRTLAVDDLTAAHGLAAAHGLTPTRDPTAVHDPTDEAREH
jgi:hypothetical protein